ncbi:hypothetical protein Q604_UNBc4C00261G0002, partial [human gut metagenome]
IKQIKKYNIGIINAYYGNNPWWGGIRNE